MKKINHAIIGAGLAGLACANRLQAAGQSVEVFEKARGAGGRLSSRHRLNSHLGYQAEAAWLSGDKLGQQLTKVMQ